MLMWRVYNKYLSVLPEIIFVGRMLRNLNFNVNEHEEGWFELCLMVKGNLVSKRIRKRCTRVSRRIMSPRGGLPRSTTPSRYKLHPQDRWGGLSLNDHSQVQAVSPRTFA